MTNHKPTNKFKAIVDVSLRDIINHQRDNVLKWFNLKNMGMELIPCNIKIPQKIKDRAWRLHDWHRVELEIEINKTGEWKLINAKFI